MLEEAETLIRLAVKNGFLKELKEPQVRKQVNEIISSTINKLTLPILKTTAVLSLRDFYKRQWREIERLKPHTRREIVLLAKLTDGGKKTTLNTQERAQLSKINSESANLYGVSLQEYTKDYINKRIKPTLDKLADMYPYDPDDISERKHRNSLRNRAEMEVRYNGHEEQLQEFRAKGVKLVIISSHADCSVRCAPYQGNVYSLDGTSGVTSDGRKYEPIEKATKNPDDRHTTAKGKTYQNGLFGFNCRHYAVEYKKGFKFPMPSKAEERKQYAITVKQRELERNVRKWRTEALEWKGVNDTRYRIAKQKATEWNKRYIEFSQDNKRAYYPDRVKII